MSQDVGWRTSVAGSYLVNLILYNFIFALLPLALTWLIRHLSRENALPGSYGAEVLFFGVMISAITFRDLADESKILHNDWIMQLLKGWFLICAIATAAMFGVLQYDTIVGSVNRELRVNLTKYASILAFALVVTSLFAEFTIAKIRAQTYGKSE